MNKMLSSWKEIAHFFGKGVRTVQRWEKTLDLPIRRPPGAPSNVVLARTSDLEEWMHRSASRRDVQELQNLPGTALRSAVEQVEAETARLLRLAPQPVAGDEADRSPLEVEEAVSRLHKVGEDLHMLQAEEVRGVLPFKKVA